MSDQNIRRGVYDSDYFSGAQVAVYIGDVWVDEITSITFQLSEPRVPLYGYADTLFRDISRGQVTVEGQLSINFKEAGYLWLILNRYVKYQRIDKKAPINEFDSKIASNTKIQVANTFNIEEAYVTRALDKQAKISKAKQNKALQQLAENRALLLRQKILTGYASSARNYGGKAEMEGAEDAFEAFENAIWKKPNANFDNVTRRATDIRINPFDIYIVYGDFTGDDRLHHTVQKLESVYLTSVGKRVIIDGAPIQEQYGFIARNLI